MCVNLPPTGRALLAALHKSPEGIPYRDPRVVTSGLTALRHRGLAQVVHGAGGATVRLTEAGRNEAMIEAVTFQRIAGCR